MQLHQKTFRFLGQLKRNNNREWFEAHRADYDAVRTQWEQFVGALTAAMTQSDPRLAGLEPKHCIFRIYRDVRFSSDKTPYKKHLSAAIAQGGKKGAMPGFYVHIEPQGEAWVGGGLWRPDGPLLARVRQEIDYNWDAFNKTVGSRTFKKTFGELYDDKLIRVPKQYSDDNPAAGVLRYKSFVYGRSFNDADVLKPEFFASLVNTHRQLLPFFRFLYEAAG